MPRNSKNNFNPETYQRIRSEVRDYLSSPSSQQKPVVFYGNGGEGKSNLLKEMKNDFEQAGYNVDSPMPESERRQLRHKLLYKSDHPVTRGQCRVKQVMLSDSNSYMDDHSVKVFDFTQ